MPYDPHGDQATIPTPITTTPEVAAYQGAKSAKITEEKRTRRQVILILLLALAIGVGSNVYAAFQVRQSQGVVREIRATQITNTGRSACEADSNHTLAQDVRNFLANDKNPADYKVPKAC